mgnify:CR=1 FL=1
MIDIFRTCAKTHCCRSITFLCCDFEKVIENLKYLRKYRDDNNSNTNIGASYVLTSANRKEKRFAEKFIGKQNGIRRIQ